MIIRIPKENKEEIIRSLQNYFYNERSEEIGHLAAENLLDFVLKEIGPYFYNQGVKDTKEMVEQKDAKFRGRYTFSRETNHTEQELMTIAGKKYGRIGIFLWA